MNVFIVGDPNSRDGSSVWDDILPEGAGRQPGAASGQI